MADRPREVLRFEHADARDDVVIIAAYDDLGIGPAVLFDGGGFMDPGRLRAYASDLLKAADWLDERHPEETCRRCGGPNVSWSAPSPLWNAVMRGGSIDGPWEFDELICPTCFCILAEERGVALGWRVDADEVRVPLAFVTPSGRRWDPDLWLWVDDTTEVPPCPVCGADLDISDRAGHLWDEHGTSDEALAAASQGRST
jgi:hypothetical protein